MVYLCAPNLDSSCFSQIVSKILSLPHSIHRGANMEKLKNVEVEKAMTDAQAADTKRAGVDEALEYNLSLHQQQSRSGKISQMSHVAANVCEHCAALIKIYTDFE